MICEKIIGEFLGICKSTKSPSTVKIYSLYGRRFSEFIGPDKKIVSISYTDIEKYRDHLIDKELSPSTINHHLIFVRNLLDFCEERGIPKGIRSKYIKLSKSRPKSHLRATKSDFRRLCEYDNTLSLNDNLRNCLIIRLAFMTGLRVSELVSIKTSDMDFDRCCVEVENLKNDFNRVVFWDEETNRLLKEYISINGLSSFLFKSPRKGGRMNPRMVQRILQKARANANIDKKITPHSLRHGFATTALLNGMNVRHVQKLLGHLHLQTTERYLQVTAMETENAYKTYMKALEI